MLKVFTTVVEEADITEVVGSPVVVVFSFKLLRVTGFDLAGEFLYQLSWFFF